MTNEPPSCRTAFPTPPLSIQHEGRIYRKLWQAKVRDIGMEKHVRCVNEFVDLQDITRKPCHIDFAENCAVRCGR